MNLRAKGFLVMLLVLGLISCTSSRTMVSTAPESRLVVKTINLVEGKHTVTVPEEIKESFKNKLELALFGTSEGQPPAFSKGSDLTLSYRFVQFNPGSRFKRWFAGGVGGYGEGSITVEVTYLRNGKKEVSKILAEGKIGAGVFGGSIDEAVSKCVEEVTSYTKANFK